MLKVNIRCSIPNKIKLRYFPSLKKGRLLKSFLINDHILHNLWYHLYRILRALVKKSVVLSLVFLYFNFFISNSLKDTTQLNLQELLFQ